MPHYFLHIFDSIQALDEEGSEYPNISAACNAAIFGAREIMREQLRLGYLNLDGFIQIVSAGGEDLLRVPYRSAVAFQGEIGSRLMTDQDN